MHSHEYDPLCNQCLVFHFVRSKFILISQSLFFNVLIYEMIWIESNTYGLFKAHIKHYNQWFLLFLFDF